MVKTFYLIFEYLLFIALIVLVVRGDADGLLVGMAHADIITTLPIVALFAFAGIMNGAIRIDIRILLGMATLALAGYHMSLIPNQGFFWGSLAASIPASYYVVVITSALFGSSRAWILLSSFFVGVESLRIVYHLNSMAGSISTEVITSIPNEDLLRVILPFFALPIIGWGAHVLAYSSKNMVFGDTNNNQHLKSTERAIKKDHLMYTPEGTTHSTERIHDLLPTKETYVDNLLGSIVYFMSRNFKAYSALGFIYDSGRGVFVLNSMKSKSFNVYKGMEIPAGSGIVGRIGAEKISFMSGNLSLYDKNDIQYYKALEPINSILVVSIISEQHELLGALVLDSRDRNAFTDREKESLKRFSSLAAALITNVHMRFNEERAARSFKIFYEVSHLFTTALSIDQVFDVLFQTVPKVVLASRMIAIMFDDETKQGIVHRIEGENNDMYEGFTFSINGGLYSFALQKRYVVAISDMRQYDGRYFRFTPEEMVDPNVRSLIIFPLIDDEQRCLGLFSIENTIPDYFTDETKQILAILIENASVAFTRALLYQKMERFATTDGLTDLNNHRRFQEILALELERARRYRRPLSLLLMDIDHFKSINDTYGHPVGDLVLKEVAGCISKSIRLNDSAARYGGEEFAVIVLEAFNRGAYATAERIRSSIERHTIDSLGRHINVTISIGCATYPLHSSNQQELIDAADKALYYSKEHGRNQITVFSQHIAGS